MCPTEITAFSDNIEKFRALNTEVIGVSVDSKFSHLAWINTPRNQGGLGEIKFPLVADITKEIARKYNVLLEEDGISLRYGQWAHLTVWAAPRRRRLIAARGHCRVCVRMRVCSGTFIIDDKGVLRHINVNDNNIGRSIEENLRLVQAIQFAAKHGEVCPANWKPGEMTVRTVNAAAWGAQVVHRSLAAKTHVIAGGMDGAREGGPGTDGGQRQGLEKVLFRQVWQVKRLDCPPPPRGGRIPEGSA